MSIIACKKMNPQKSVASTGKRTSDFLLRKSKVLLLSPGIIHKGK